MIEMVTIAHDAMNLPMTASVIERGIVRRSSIEPDFCSSDHILIAIGGISTRKSHGRKLNKLYESDAWLLPRKFPKGLDPNVVKPVNSKNIIIKI